MADIIEVEQTPPETRAELLALLRDKDAGFGYDGPDDLVQIKQFINDGGHDLGGLDIDAIFKRTTPPRVVKWAKPTETDDDKAVRLSGKAGAVGRATNASITKTEKASLAPWQIERMMTRKRYERQIARKESMWDSVDHAEAFGAFVRSKSAALIDYSEKSRDLDIVQKAGSTGVFTDAGAFIAPEFLPQLIELRERYGVYERECGETPMRNNELTIPRNQEDAGVLWNGEGSAITEDDPDVDNVKLVANKLAGLYKLSNELLNDSAVSISDMVTRGYVRQAAFKVDRAGFVGDALPANGGFTGLTTALTDLSGTIANIAGLVVASGNLFSEFAALDFTTAIGVLPDYVTNPKWYMHRVVYGAVVERLGRAAGGVTYSEFMGSRPTMTLFGLPVVFVQGAMPKADANSQVAVLLGDISLSSKFGRVRNSMEIMTSEHRYFENDQWAIRFRERVAILNHDVGNASATAASRQAGPVVGIISASS